MWKFVSNGAMIFAGVVALPPIVNVNDASATTYALRSGASADPRLSMLKRFFEASGAPAKAYAHVFLSAADYNQLDWRLLPSISFVETTGGKWARNNNLFGWDCGRAVFTSISEGIRRVAHHLGHSTRYKDKELDEILWAYNPNPEYSRIVKSVMDRIAPAE